MNKLIDTIRTFLDNFKHYNIMIIGILSIIYFTFNLNQEEYSDVLDNLSVSIFSNEKVIKILDNIFFNLSFAGIFSSITFFVFSEVLLFVFVSTDRLDNLYRKFKRAHIHTMKLFQFSLPALYFAHILLYYKLRLDDFLLSLGKLFSAYHIAICIIAPALWLVAITVPFIIQIIKDKMKEKRKNKSF